MANIHYTKSHSDFPWGISFSLLGLIWASLDYEDYEGDKSRERASSTSAECRNAPDRQTINAKN